MHEVLKDIEKLAIERIKFADGISRSRYGKPIDVAYSGGKDSDVLIELFLRSGVEFTVTHSLTTVDAPPTIYHIRDTFSELEKRGIHTEIDIHRNPDGPPTTMWNLIVKKGFPPTRRFRYCCAELKETHGGHAIVAAGIRAAESVKRMGRGTFSTTADRKEYGDEVMLFSDNDDRRQMMEHCVKKSTVLLNPIVDWTTAEVWAYLEETGRKPCELYKKFSRVGCVGCPMAIVKNRIKEFKMFPAYERNYKRAFAKMLDARKERSMTGLWKNEDDVFNWWMDEERQIPGQMSLEWEEEE